MKRFLLVAVLAMTLMLAMTVPALAKSGETQGKLVLNVTYKVTNDVDSGFFGNWALDNYVKHVQVWQTGENTFYVVASYEGKWQTFEGAPSPGAGVSQGDDASGTFQGGYTATFDYTGPVEKAAGYIGTHDLGGDETLSGITTPYSVLGEYFPGYTGFAYTDGGDGWSWTYHYQSQTWLNAGGVSAADSGDIVIP